MNLCVQANLGGFFCGFGAEPATASLSFNPIVNDPNVNDQDSEARDIELLRQIAVGDRAAFAEFYDRHSILMFSVASRILNDPADAEDVMQEAFVQIWEKARAFDAKLGKASSWAAILVRNKAIDRIRASQRRSRLAQEAGPESWNCRPTSGARSKWPIFPASPTLKSRKNCRNRSAPSRPGSVVGS